MVSYYNHSAMYRHQQAISGQPGQFHHQVNPWYNTGYHHQANNQMGGGGTNGPTTYCMQEEQQMWHHHPHAVWHQDYTDFISAHPPPPSMSMQPHMEDHQNQPQLQQQLPSPTVTVSGSEMSSPGGGSGNASPGNGGQTRPVPVRSPYEWIKKTSYQTQQTPGRTRTKDKYRVVYTDFQRIELEKEFTYFNKYITLRRKAELASNLGLSERQIKIWFQNRRAKERKQLKKRLEETQKDDSMKAAHLHQYELKMHHLQQIQQMQLQKMQQDKSGRFGMKKEELEYEDDV